MDYRKLDAALAASLEDVEDPEEQALHVFIHTDHAPAPTEAAVLKRLGVREGIGDRRVFSATLSPRAVEELSTQPWVKYLRLSQRLHLVQARPE